MNQDPSQATRPVAASSAENRHGPGAAGKGGLRDQRGLGPQRRGGRSNDSPSQENAGFLPPSNPAAAGLVFTNNPSLNANSAPAPTGLQTKTSGGGGPASFSFGSLPPDALPSPHQTSQGQAVNSHAPSPSPPTAVPQPGPPPAGLSSASSISGSVSVSSSTNGQGAQASSNDRARRRPAQHQGGAGGMGGCLPGSDRGRPGAKQGHVPQVHQGHMQQSPPGPGGAMPRAMPAQNLVGYPNPAMMAQYGGYSGLQGAPAYQNMYMANPMYYQLQQNMMNQAMYYQHTQAGVGQQQQGSAQMGHQQHGGHMGQQHGPQQGRGGQFRPPHVGGPQAGPAGQHGGWQQAPDMAQGGDRDQRGEHTMHAQAQQQGQGPAHIRGGEGFPQQPRGQQQQPPYNLPGSATAGAGGVSPQAGPAQQAAPQQPSHGFGAAHHQGQQQQRPSPQQRPPQPQPQQQQAISQPAYPKRERKVLKIVDPNTNKAVELGQREAAAAAAAAANGPASASGAASPAASAAAHPVSHHARVASDAASIQSEVPTPRASDSGAATKEPGAAPASKADRQEALTGKAESPAKVPTAHEAAKTAATAPEGSVEQEAAKRTAAAVIAAAVSSVGAAGKVSAPATPAGQEAPQGTGKPAPAAQAAPAAPAAPAPAAKSAEVKPAAAKAVEAKPSMVKAAEAKPVAVKGAEAKPAAAKPAEKPVAPAGQKEAAGMPLSFAEAAKAQAAAQKPSQEAEISNAPPRATPAAQPKLDEAAKPQQQEQAAPAADRSTAGAPASAAAASAPAKPEVATFAAMASQAPKAAAGAAAEVAKPAAKPTAEPVAKPAAASPKQQGKDDIDAKLQAAAAADVAKAAASTQSAAPADSTVEKLPQAKSSMDKQSQQPAAAEPQQQQQATTVPAAAAAAAAPSQAQPTNLAANVADALTGKAPEVAKPEASAKEADSKKDVVSAKQTRKQMLRNADAKGASLADADPFAAPQKQAAEAVKELEQAEEKAAENAAQPQPENAVDRSGSMDVPGEWDEQDASPRPVGVAAAAPVATGSSETKMYTRDFLLNLQKRPQCQELPPGFERDPQLLRSEPALGRDMEPPARGGRGGPGRGMPPPAQRGPDKWQQSGPLPGPPAGGRGGRGGPPPVVEDRWGKKSLPPPPPGMQGGAGGPVTQLHRSKERFQMGQLRTDNPEEEKKQKAIKGLLNKITPDKFEKILGDLVMVGYESEETESGLIAQVFDKALTETTFSEIYAEMCRQLNARLPTFEPVKEGKKQQSTFRKQLLNKCQEEFEKGAAAMDAVTAREKAEKDKAKDADEEEEDDGAADQIAAAAGEDAPKDLEEGEIAQSAGDEKATAPQKEEKDMTPAERKAARIAAKRAVLLAAEEELKGRRRALGNMQFIGHLYRQKMLTERIMHECIKKLLADVAEPRPEDLECLAKLLSTIGKQLDDNPNPTNREHMNMYFMRIQQLTRHDKLESRIRFMLQGLIELRQNNYVARRQVEGPKKISEVHSDAQREATRQRNAPAPRRGPSQDLSAYGGPPSRQRAPTRQDTQMDQPMRAMHRNSSQEFTSLRPGGGSLRPGGMQQRVPSQKDLRPAAPAASASKAPAAAAAVEAAAPAAPALSPDALRAKVNGLLTQFLKVDKDLGEASLSFKELLQQNAQPSAAVEVLLLLALDLRGVNWEEVQRLMLHLATGEEAVVQEDALQGAMLKLLEQIAVQDVFTDSPKATEWIGGILGALLAEDALQLKPLVQAVLQAGEAPDMETDDPPLVDGGWASKLVAATLQALEQHKGPGSASPAWKATGIKFAETFPSFERDDEKVQQKLLSQFGLDLSI